jgi:nitroreductase
MTLPEIQNRRSHVAFSPLTIEQIKLDILFEAARWAPSSMNIQPWRFIYALHDEPAFGSILDALMDGNKRWAKDAGLLVLTLAQVEYNRKGTHYQNRYAWHDVGAANALLMIQADKLGLVSHPMGGFDPEQIRKSFLILKDFDPVTIIALGYPGNISALPEDLLQRQQGVRVRKAMDEIVFHGELR